MEQVAKTKEEYYYRNNSVLGDDFKQKQKTNNIKSVNPCPAQHPPCQTAKQEDTEIMK
jgi:hypothetical protein